MFTRLSKRTQLQLLSKGVLAWQVCFAALIGLITFGLVHILPNGAPPEAEIFSLTPIDYATLSSAALSDNEESFIVVAKVSPNNFTNKYGFVAYQTQRSESDGQGQKSWVFESNTSPALELEMQGGTFRIQSGYAFSGDLHTEGNSNQRFTGFKVGDELVVYGRIDSNRDTIIVKPQEVFVGNYVELRARSQHYSRLEPKGCGLIAGLIAFSILRWHNKRSSAS
jgi:hypothetical protein